MINKKTIIIDFGKISTPYCGLAETSLNFAHALNNLQNCEFEFVYIVPKALREEFNTQIGVQAIVPRYWGIYRILYYMVRQKRFLCRLPKFDLYHYLHFYSPWGPGGKNDKHLLLTVHDFHAMERKRAARRLRKKVKAVGAIAFISKFASLEYKNYFKNSAISTSVIPNGVRVPPHVDDSYIQHWREKFGNYLFTLGGLKRKNIHALVGMMEKAEDFENLKHLKLVVAGNIKTDYQNELNREIEIRGLQDKIVFLGGVNDDVKFQLIAACHAFVFPSLQEGFGLPIIEAMHFGKPVFSSDKTSLPEVGGDNAYYWHKFEPDYMARELSEGLAKEELQSGSRERIAYAQKFDWQKNAEQYLELYKKILAD